MNISPAKEFSTPTSSERGDFMWFYRRKNGILLCDLLSEYLSDAALRGTRGLTDLRRCAQLACEILGGDRYAVQIGALDLHRFQRELVARKYAANTVNKVLAVTLSALRFGARTERVPSVPQGPRRVPPAPPRRGFLTYEGFRAIDEALPVWARGPWRFGYWSGWRRREVLGLLWDEVEEGVIRLDPSRSKNRRPRTLAIADEIALVISEQRRLRIDTLPYVFHRDERRISMTWYYTIFRRTCESLGRKGVLFHDTRRSASRDLKRAQVPDTIAMDITGHASRKMHDQYNITDEEELAESQRLLGEYRRSKKGVDK